MNSLRSPLHIPFTYQFVCAPVGAHSLPFTCFASHTLSFLTRSYFIPPNPFYGVRYTHNIFYWGSAAAYCFCSPAGRTHSYRSPFRFSPFRPSVWPTLAQGCFTCVSAQDSIPIYKTTLITFYHLLFVPNLQSY